jgi:hypothetical protein
MSKKEGPPVKLHTIVPQSQIESMHTTITALQKQAFELQRALTMVLVQNGGSIRLEFATLMNYKPMDISWEQQNFDRSVTISVQEPAK